MPQARYLTISYLDDGSSANFEHFRLQRRDRRAVLPRSKSGGWTAHVRSPFSRAGEEGPETSPCPQF